MHRAYRGFTIIELLTVMVVVAILATIGAPSLREMMIKGRVRTASSDLYSSLVFTRSEAIKRNATVTLAPVTPNDWSSGWTVKVGTTTLETKDAPPLGVTWAGTPPASIVFGGNGRATSSGEFQMRSTEYATVQMRCITISPSGRPNIKTDTNGNYADGCN